MKRRTLLLAGAGAAGALVVGWGLLPPRSRLGRAGLWPPADGEVALNGWIKIARDGRVLLAMNRSEMGQGVHTALAMLVAEELDVALRQVVLVPAGHDALYGNVAMFVGSLPFHPTQTEPGQESRGVRVGSWMVAKVARELGINATGGSATIADAWEPLRLAAATARAQLVGAASLAWKQPAAELVVREGVVQHEATSMRAHFGELATRAAATPPGDVQPKPVKDRRLVGTPAPRIDLAAKVDGSAVFGIDVRPPGLLFAVIRHCPALGGGPGAVRTEPAMARAGVLRVVRLAPMAGSTAALAVVGISTWHAKQGADALEVDWQPPPAGTVDTAKAMLDLEAAAREHAGLAFHASGDAAQALAAAPRRIERVYRAPYLAHATMEPINCTAQVKDGHVEVWASTQVPGLGRAAAAQVAGVPVDAVTVHVTYLGGGFGRRLDVDMVAQAVRVAVETGGRPVQLVWPREEDFTHDFYRPAGVALMRAGLDDKGRPVALAITSAGDAITPRWMERVLPALAGPVDLPDKTASEGLFDLPYAIPNQRIAHVATTIGVPVGFWRSVGHSHNAFFAEGFVDELAAEAREDPVAFRLGLLNGLPRHAAVLKLAAEKSRWGSPLAPGRARGVALHESFGSIVAQVAEVSIDSGRPRVHRVVCVADVGTVVNPGIVAQQMEGAVIYGLAAALTGRVDIENGVVKQRNFPDLRLPTLADAPVVETHLIASDRPPSGVGEPGTPPIAPAVANALFVLTGNRIRDLPFMR